MKDLITTIGAILILSIFISQFVANEKNYMKMRAVDHVTIDFFRERDDPGTEEIEALKEDLAQVVGCHEDEVQVKVEEEEREYQVELPLSDIIGGWKILGIKEEENKKIYVSEGRF